MDISKKRIHEILGNTSTQYFVPIYQRQYSWRERNCEQLFENILEIKNLKKEHYIGSIVISKSETVDGINVRSIIDGQQRLTTLTLFILSFLCSENSEIQDNDKERIKDSYLINKYSKNLKTKMKFIDTDQEIFEKILTSLENKLKWDEKLTDEQKNTRLVENLNYFIDKIRVHKFTSDDLSFIFEKILCASISLEENDNPQLIFETMNSTGMNLNQGDLIKNFLLLDLSFEDQNNVYIRYWKDMESYLLKKEKMDIFFKHYLTIQNEKICNENQIYQTFKNYYSSKWQKSQTSKINVIENIYKYFKSFKTIIEKSTKSQEINNSLNFLNILDLDTLNPIIIEIINNYLHNNEVEWQNEKNIKSIIDICLSYVVRRQFCDLPSGSVNKVIEKFVRYAKNKDWYERLCFEFINLKNTVKAYFPNDDHFKQNFITKEFYFMKSGKQILQILETFSNYKNNELSASAIKKSTLEHILPKGENLPEFWRKELGENWKEKWNEWVQTIGNITFTLYNSEMSNKSFLEKKKMNGGFLDSNFWLNKFVNEQDHWNVEKIQERANLLFETALKIWPFPKIDEEILKKYNQNKNNGLDDDSRDEESVYDLDWYDLSDYQMDLYNNFLNFFENNYSLYSVDTIFNKSYIRVDLDNKGLFRLHFKKDKMLVYLNKLGDDYKEKYENYKVINANVMIHYPHYKYGFEYDKNNLFEIKSFLNQYIKEKVRKS